MSTPEQQQPATPAVTKKKRRKWPWIVLGVVVFLWIVGQCSNHDQHENPPAGQGESSTATSPVATSASATSSTQAQPPATATTTQGPQPPSGVQDLRWDVRPGPDGDMVTAKYKIGEGLTKGLTKDDARMDTVSILKYAQAAYPNAAEVEVDAFADMVDIYGRTSVEQVATLTYSRATLDRINWDNFNFKNVWNIPIADSADVHPAFQY